MKPVAAFLAEGVFFGRSLNRARRRAIGSYGRAIAADDHDGPSLVTLSHEQAGGPGQFVGDTFFAAHELQPGRMLALMSVLGPWKLVFLTEIWYRIT